jgi:hypothetical protein
VRGEALKVIIDGESGGGSDWCKLWGLASPGNVDVYAVCVREGCRGLSRAGVEKRWVERIEGICAGSEFARSMIEVVFMDLE